MLRRVRTLIRIRAVAGHPPVPTAIQHPYRKELP
jgi:hypothetical protein